MDRGREVLIHHLLSLLPVLDTQPSTQYGNIVEVFFWPTRHKLAGQDISQVVRYVEQQLLVCFEQAHGRKIILTKLKQKGSAVIVEEHLLLSLQPVTFPNAFDNASNLIGNGCIEDERTL